VAAVLLLPFSIDGLTVTGIGNQAFLNATNVSSVTIPNSVTTIGELGFDQCYDLASVTIPGSVTNIGELTFWNCYRLTNATISNGVTSIASSMFAACLGPMPYRNSIRHFGCKTMMDKLLLGKICLVQI
jgi:hypothetical protein